MFLDSRKGRLNPRKGLEIWLPRRNLDHPDLPKGAHSDRKNGSKRGAIPSFERRKGPRASGPQSIYPYLFLHPNFLVPLIDPSVRLVLRPNQHSIEKGTLYTPFLVRRVFFSSWSCKELLWLCLLLAVRTRCRIAFLCWVLSQGRKQGS